MEFSRPVCYGLLSRGATRAAARKFPEEIRGLKVVPFFLFVGRGKFISLQRRSTEWDHGGCLIGGVKNDSLYRD